MNVMAETAATGSSMKSNLIDGYLLIKCDMMKIHAEKN